VRFIWDPANAAEHLAKHGVSFAEGATAYEDPDAYFEPNIHHPERMNVIGRSAQNKILYVVTIEIIADEVVHIVTVWPATREQRARYENQY